METKADLLTAQIYGLRDAPDAFQVSEEGLHLAADAVMIRFLERIARVATTKEGSFLASLITDRFCVVGEADEDDVGLQASRYGIARRMALLVPFANLQEDQLDSVDEPAWLRRMQKEAHKLHWSLGKKLGVQDEMVAKPTLDVEEMRFGDSSYTALVNGRHTVLTRLRDAIGRAHEIDEQGLISDWPEYWDTEFGVAVRDTDRSVRRLLCGAHVTANGDLTTERLVELGTPEELPGGIKPQHVSGILMQQLRAMRALNLVHKPKKSSAVG